MTCAVEMIYEIFVGIHVKERVLREFVWVRKLPERISFSSRKSDGCFVTGGAAFSYTVTNVRLHLDETLITV